MKSGLQNRLKMIRIPNEITSVLDVFTPYKPAMLNYIKRSGPEKDFERIFTIPGMQINIKGVKGSGKTSMIQHILQAKRIPHIITMCTSGDTIQQMIEDVFQTLHGMLIQFEEGERSKETYYEKKESANQVTNTYFNCYNAKINIPSLKNQLPIKTDKSLCVCLGSSGFVWVIDDFQVLLPQERTRWLDILKLFNEWSNKYNSLRIITIGQIIETSEMLCFRPDLATKIAEIKVPLMSVEELCAVITKGEQLLNISFAEHLHKEMLNLQQNTLLPSACHQVFLYLCLKNRIEFAQAEIKKIVDMP